MNVYFLELLENILKSNEVFARVLIEIRYVGKIRFNPTESNVNTLFHNIS